MTTDTWYKPHIERSLLKQLVRRKDRDGLVHVVGYVALLCIAGYWAYRSIGSGWSIVAFSLYGGLWVFATSVAHETSHGTAFRTRWINEVVLFVSGLMVQQTPTGLRWTHARHHSDTSMVGKDVEIVLQNPIRRGRFLWAQLADINSIWYYFSRVVMLSFYKLDGEHKECVPDQEVPRLVFEARVFFIVYAIILVWSIWANSWTPFLLFIFPRIAGAPVHGVMLACQHIGLEQNVTDHRRTTRTMLVNPFLRFIYWNMNYHIEHHLFPSVPFHALPRLHNEIKDDLILPPTKGVMAALREMFDVIRSGNTLPG